MTRQTIRYIGVAAAAVMAVVYVAIGIGVVQVVDPATGTDLLPFGLSAGGLFLVGAVLLATTDRRPLWIVGAFLQVGVAIMYVVVGQTRTPPFEIWGVTLRLIQIPLFAVLVYLAVRSPDARPARA